MADYVDGMLLPTTAKLRRGKYTDADLARLRKLAAAGAYDPDAVADAVFFPVDASANTIDSYGTFMLPSTLKNFAEDATTGVAVLDSHNSRRLNFGMSVTGEYLEEGDLRYMRSDFFTLPGLQTEGLDTDTYIKGVQAGLFRDVSVGFWMPPGAMVRCTICGKDMMRWWADEGCSHFPGMEYELAGEGTTRAEIAYGAVDGGRLSEYSFVHDGATPGAGIAKARNMEESGELDPNVALRLERAYQTTFPRATRKYQGIARIGDNDMTVRKAHKPDEDADKLIDQEPAGINDNPTMDDALMVDAIEPTTIAPLLDDTSEAEATTEAVADAEADAEDTGERAIEKSGLKFTKGLRDALNERYADTGIRLGERVSDAVIVLADEVKNLREQLTAKNQSIRTLENEAKIGRAYRSDMIAELEREVIRSATAEEDTEAKVARYRKMAESADIEDIKGLRDDFAAVARAKYGAGRRSEDIEEDGATRGKRPAAALPPSAYDDQPR